MISTYSLDKTSNVLIKLSRNELYSDHLMNYFLRKNKDIELSREMVVSLLKNANSINKYADKIIESLEISSSELNEINPYYIMSYVDNIIITDADFVLENNRFMYDSEINKDNVYIQSDYFDDAVKCIDSIIKLAENKNIKRKYVVIRKMITDLKTI